MDRVEINAKGFCEVARAVITSENKAGVYKDIKITRLYRSDGYILEKHEIKIPTKKIDWHTLGFQKKKFSFGWKVLGRTVKDPREWLANYKDNWKITKRSPKFMLKYISAKQIKRLKNGL